MSPTNPEPRAFLLGGATATGKSAVIQLLAEQTNGRILSADAMLVYAGMDIGTAKPSRQERARVPYAGLDLVTPAQPFSTGAWLDAARQILADHFAQTPEQPLYVTGGTGLYLKALTDGLDATPADPAIRTRWQDYFAAEGAAGLRAALAARAPLRLAALDDPHNPRRLIRALELAELGHPEGPASWTRATPACFPALRWPRPLLHARIAARVRTMFDQGLLDEVAVLMRDFPTWSDTAARAIGYAEVRDHLLGRLTRKEAEEQIVIRTRQLAKRQETWLRHQATIVWIDLEAEEPPAVTAQRVLEVWRTHGNTHISHLLSDPSTDP